MPGWQPGARKFLEPLLRYSMQETLLLDITTSLNFLHDKNLSHSAQTQIRIITGNVLLK